MAISSLMRYSELPPSSASYDSDPECLNNGEFMPSPAARWPARRGACGRRNIWDCARFLNLDLENSLTAYAVVRQHKAYTEAVDMLSQFLLSTGCHGSPYVFLAVLIDSQMHRTKRASANFLLDNILIDTMYGSPIVFAVHILRAGMQRLFDLTPFRVVSVMVSQRTTISWTRSGVNWTIVSFEDL